MGYDLHITRRRWWHDDGDDITRDEFTSVVEGDREFTYPGIGGRDYADWQNPGGDYRSWICWSEGRIHTKNPSVEFIDKLTRLAQLWSAKVQGDDGEVYLSSREVLPPPAPEIRAQQGIDSERVEVWTMRLGLGACFVACIVIFLLTR